MSARPPALSGELSEKPIYEIVRAIHAGAGTGTLEVSIGDQKRKLYFVDGELYLASSHPLAKHLGELVGQLRDPAAAEARSRCIELVQRIAGLVADWQRGSYRFSLDPQSVPADRVGPLPTERLIMMVASHGVDEDEIVRRMGGEGAQIVVRASPPKPDALGLLPEEVFLLERLAQPMTVGKILAESPMQRIDALHAMLHLKTTGRLRVLGKDGSGAKTVLPQVAPEVEFQARMLQRFAQSLQEEPLALPDAEFRQRVTDLVGRIGGLNAYELLGVAPSTPDETVQAKYEDLARTVHPANEAAYRLSGLKPMLEMLFERATGDFFTLSDPERRRQYNERHVIEVGAATVTGAAREEEQRELALRHYDQALALAARGDFHSAVQLLELAVNTDPRVDYYLALARIQARNPKWIERAIESCRSAVELDGHNADARCQLGEMYEAAGDPARARVQFQAAVRENPQHIQAAARLRALEGSKPEARGPSGLFDRLFGRKS